MASLPCPDKHDQSASIISGFFIELHGLLFTNTLIHLSSQSLLEEILYNPKYNVKCNEVPEHMSRPLGTFPSLLLRATSINVTIQGLLVKWSCYAKIA